MEEGKFSCKAAVQRAYGIHGGGTIGNWIAKYGKENLLTKVVKVETPKEVSEMKQLRKRVRELEKGLADAHLDLKLEEAYTRIACKAAGIEDVDAFKKKHGGNA
jgi:hypothetical protein